MKKNSSVDLATFIIRIAFGIMYLAHGLTKLLVFTPSGTAAYFTSLGFPALLGYLVIVFEIGGGILLLAGFFTRLIALLAVIEMITISQIHSVNGWTFSNPGGGWEYPAFMAFIALALMFLGSGKLKLNRLFHHNDFNNN